MTYTMAKGTVIAQHHLAVVSWPSLSKFGVGVCGMGVTIEVHKMQLVVLQRSGLTSAVQESSEWASSVDFWWQVLWGCIAGSELVVFIHCPGPATVLTLPITSPFVRDTRQTPYSFLYLFSLT